MSDTTMRHEFETWYSVTFDDECVWDEKRNSYFDVGCHYAWKGYQAAMAQQTLERIVKVDCGDKSQPEDEVTTTVRATIAQSTVTTSLWQPWSTRPQNEDYDEFLVWWSEYQTARIVSFDSETATYVFSDGSDALKYRTPLSWMSVPEQPVKDLSSIEFLTPKIAQILEVNKLCEATVAPVVQSSELWRDKAIFLIHFDDQEMRPEIWTGEAAARARFKTVSDNWNAHLFVKVISNSHDDVHASDNALMLDPAIQHNRSSVWYKETVIAKDLL